MTVTLADKRGHLREAVHKAFEPPSSLPMWQWWEQNIKLDKTAAASGAYSTELVPMVRIWCDYAQSPLTRRLVMMVSAQSTKTQNVINLLLWLLENDPATTMWVMASDTSVKEFAKKRLFPALDDCRAVERLVPTDRKRRMNNLVMFLTMNLILRGSNSRAGLQSDPVKRIICDERREWKKGAIDLLRKRLRTFADACEYSLGTAGEEKDELHVDFMAGSQTFIHWNCPKCQHSQPFRFGRAPSTLFPEARERGGIIWDSNEITKPNGNWNYTEVLKTVSYECEHCGERLKNHQKLALLKTFHEFHRNPAALPEFPSLHWGALYMPWRSCSFEAIALEFLKACAAMKLGNIEPMKAFITETLGEPWRDEREQAKPSDLLERKGTYRSGERWRSTDADPVADLMAIDVQAGYLVFGHRQFRQGGASRMVKCGKFFGFEEARQYQTEQNMNAQCVFVDSPYRQPEVFKACLKYGWNAMLGDDALEFSQQVLDPTTKKMQAVRTTWKSQLVDPSIGTSEMNRTVINRFSWSNTHYNERLFLEAIRGLSDPWEIPQDISEEYLAQMQAVQRVTKVDEKGIASHEWRESGRHDFPDVEKMLLVAADICHLTKAKYLI